MDLEIEPARKRLLFEQLERHACRNHRHDWSRTKPILEAAGLAPPLIEQVFEHMRLRHTHCDCQLLKLASKGPPS